MGRRTSILKPHFLARSLAIAIVIAPLLLSGQPPNRAEATRPISGQTISFGTGNDVGASADNVYEVAVGDLDNDGDLDIVSGSGSGEDNEVIAWENDGSPFSGSWTQHDVGASADHVISVALGDLDDDGDLDIVSGSYSGEDNEVIAWENDGFPFSGTWIQRDVGASTDNVFAVALGDLDNDGDLDIAAGTGSAEDYEVIAWGNDGSPFTGLWSQCDVGTSTSSVYSVALGALDNDGDLDVASSSGSAEDYEIIAWQNTLVHRNMPFDHAGHNAGVAADHLLSLCMGDLDNDGDTDIVSGSWSDADHELIVWKNDGSPFIGSWAGSDVGASVHGIGSVALGDLDGDGDLDIVSSSYSDEDYEVIAWENDATPFVGVWSDQDVGSSTSSVYSVALGDLDNDGDLDIVSGSGVGEDYEVIAWQNDGTPFNGLWSQQDVGATTDHVVTVALGDLDNDGDLDIISGSFSGEDNEVIAWENDGSPFLGSWPQHDVGPSTDSVRSLALGDLDNDGDLDIVSGSFSGEDYELAAWENDGSPFDAIWLQNDMGTAAANVRSIGLGDLDRDGDLDAVSGSAFGGAYQVVVSENDGTPFSGQWTQYGVGPSSDSVNSVALADLDNDGDPDIVSASGINEDYELIAWLNKGGSAGYEVTATAPPVIHGTEALLRMVVTHNGIAEDNDIELTQWDLLFEKSPGDPLGSIEANNLIETLYVYLSSDDTWEPTDTVITTITSMSLASGMQTINFPDGAATVQVSEGTARNYFLAVEFTPTACRQHPNSFAVTFDPDAHAVVEDRAEDSSVSIQDSDPVSTGVVSPCDCFHAPLVLRRYSNTADVIFRNGVVLTMEPSHPQAAALAVRGERIMAVGSNSQVMALWGPDTHVVDLAGRTLLPGFIDGHTHVLFFPHLMGQTLQDAMDLALSYGLTTVNEKFADDAFLEQLMSAEQEGTLRLRVNVFAPYNTGTLDDGGNTMIVEVWFPEHGPILDSDRRVRIPGVKVFTDGGWSPGRGCWALTAPYPKEFQDDPMFQWCFHDDGDLYLTQRQLNQVVVDAQAAGFRVSFHACGDRAIDHALNAIENALDGAPNEQYRHQIQHNSALRPDQLTRYASLNVVASLRGYFNTCEQDEYPFYFGPGRYEWLANRYALPGLGIHVFAEGDFAWTADPSDRTSPRTIDPMLYLYGLVTHQQLRGDGTACQPDQWIAKHEISVEEGLRLLTIEPAFAVSQEEAIGSLKPGKFADLVILSGNPLAVDPNSIKDLQALMTMVGGHVEYCAAGYDWLCPTS